MKIIIIAALNRKLVIGNRGALPWHIPKDMQRFKKLTTGHTVVMGRKTFESLGTPLPRRRNIILTRTIPRDQLQENTEFYPTVEAALARLHNNEKVFIIGGGEIYRQFLDRADELLLTVVENDEDGDVFFPEYGHLIGSRFILAETEQHTGYAFHTYKKTG